MTATVSEKTRLKEVKKFRDVIINRRQRFTDVCKFAHEVFEASSVSIALLDDKQSELIAYYGLYSPRLPREKSLSTQVVEHGMTVCVPDVGVLPDRNQSLTLSSCGIQSYLAVPLTVGPGLRIGSLIVSFDAKQQFASRHVSMIEGLGNTVNSLLTVNRLKLQEKARLAKVKKMLARLTAQQAQLWRNDRMFDNVSKMAGIGGWEVDLATGQTFWSPQVYKIHEIENAPAYDIPSAINSYAEEARPMLVAMVDRAVATGQSFEFELPLLTAKGKWRTVKVMGDAEMENGHVVRLFGTIQDVTEQRAAEKLTLQLQKMDALGRLTGGISHDFNNILAVIIGNLQISLKEQGSNGNHSASISAALAAARRGVKITSKLLNFSHTQTPVIEEIRPAALVRDIASMLSDTCGPGIRLSVEIIGDPWPILSDASQLESALLNLVVNARDATTGEGEVMVKVENQQVNASSLGFPADLGSGDYVRISITDHGSGIPKSILGKVIEPFFTTKSVGRGTGLGMSIVHSFVTGSGGAMNIESDEGTGTTVDLFLPRAHASESREPVSKSEPLNILVVDDEGDIRTMAMSMLRHLGYASTGAPDAHSALQLLRDGHNPAILFTDVRMPGGMNGVQLAEEAKIVWPGLKVILTSGYAGDDEVIRRIEAGGFPFLPKPYDVNGLNMMIESVLRAGENVAC